MDCRNLQLREGMKMENVDIKAKLLEEFNDDPLYKLCLMNGLEEYLFNENILSLHINASYSTVETGRFIERPDSTIRNHFRSDLVDYIAPERFGKYYRLSAYSVFRLHMIFLLMEKAQKTTVDLLAELGMQPTPVVGGNLKRVARFNQQDSRGLRTGYEDLDEEYVSNQRFEKLEHAFGLQAVMLNILKYEKDIADLERKIDYNRSTITQITTDNRMKFLEEKQSRLLTSSLKRTQKKPSFKDFFKKSEEVEIEKIESEINLNLKEKYDKELQESIEKYSSDISKLEQEKTALITSLEKEKDSFSKLQLNSSPKLGISENKD